MMYTQSANWDNKMNYVNFKRKYIKDNAWDISTTCLWEHVSGAVAQIDSYPEDNYVFISFENGPTLDIQIKGSVIKVGFHDDVRKRDLSDHPAWETRRELLVKLYLRFILSLKTTHEQRDAVLDIVSNELTF